MGKCLYKALVPETSHDVVQGLIQKGFAGTATENVEIQLHTKRNNTVDLLLNCTTNRDASGHAIGVIAVGQDISERKEVEMEKTRIAAELPCAIAMRNSKRSPERIKQPTSKLELLCRQCELLRGAELLLDVTTKRDLSAAVVCVIGMHVSATRLHACECFGWLRTYRGVDASEFMPCMHG
jgi:hypothetical protein